MSHTTSATYLFNQALETLQYPPLEITDSLKQIQQARSHRVLLEVDLAAIRHNVGVITQLAHGSQIMAVLKRDAYGLGARVIAQELRSNGVQAFAVDNVAEGVELRLSGITEPILVIDGDIPQNIPTAITHNLMPGIPHEELLLAYEHAASKRDSKYPVWLVANVGFNRSGYRNVEQFTHFVRQAYECKHLEVKAIYGHLTNSNGDAQISLAQISEFQKLLHIAETLLGNKLESSLFASHGILRWSKDFPTHWVRPGILLYGEHALLNQLVEPETKKVVERLRPAIKLKARVTSLLQFTQSEAIGYGQRYIAKSGQRLATISIGFGSGYPFRSTKLYALVHGHQVPLFGDVGMDALQIDVTNVPNINLYDWVTLIGKEGKQHISVHSLAIDAETTPYQLLSAIHCPHLYIDFQRGSHDDDAI